MSFTYKFSIEEQYFLVDADSKSPVGKMPAALITDAKSATGGRVNGEVLHPQVEVATIRHSVMREARAELRFLRQTVAAAAAKRGLAIMAAGTHPSAASEPPRHPAADIDDDDRLIVQRDMLCGLHVHVELPDPEDRIDMMCRMLPYLPLFVALATSSPFWRSRPTGLKDYRLAAYDELPGTGVPELFRLREDYDAYVAALTHAGIIEDSSYMRWAIRPSLKRPTLELRAPDSCTRVEDALAIAALYRALACHLTRNPWLNWDLTPVDRAVVVENKWRAQRYGVAGTFVDMAGNGALSVAALLEQVIAHVHDDAIALGCLDEVLHCRAIVGGGTSADAQLAVFEQARHRTDDSAALHAVTDWIAEATLQ